MTLALTKAALAIMRAHAEESFPEECCGALFASPGGLEVRRMTNIQNRLHAADPTLRDARTAYSVDPAELLDVVRTGDRPGWRLVAFYHSHPDHDAYFSATDRARALWGEGPDAEPSYPGLSWIVLSVHGRRVGVVKAFAWDEGTRDFRELPLTVGA